MPAPRFTHLMASCLTLLLGAALAAAPSTASDIDDLDGALGEIQQLIDGAHFRTALAVAESGRELTAPLEPTPEAREASARLEVLAATCQVALGDESGARESLTRAVRLWPALSLDERNTSPRVVRIFDGLPASPPAADGVTP